ncbi:electron transport complex subunit RsxC [Eubacteriales bacterium OttesenSCG-928-A19]|nr:electron transport complex subunit RsxC [Eubacteriales bacterium OttesenSCG-928-A19]
MKKYTFKGGTHPLRWQHEGKTATAGLAIREFVSDSVCIPVDMHLGAPSTPVVKKGDHVRIGQVIAEAVGPRGIPVHASVSGDVTAVGIVQQMQKMPSNCITIQNDFADEWVELSPLGDVESVPVEKIVPAIQAAGIAGMGGATFPTHAKLAIPAGKTIDTVLLNGAECEPFLTSDHRLMLEFSASVVNGLRAAMRAVGARKGIICIEDNKPDAIEAMRKAASGRTGVEVAAMKTKYPQGGEKQVIQAVLGREVPSGGLPMDAHVVVLNVATAAAIADAITLGKPSIQRVVTITGRVREPGNLLLRIGTIVNDAVSGCGGYTEEPGMIIAGGNMMGLPMPDDNVSITKATNGVVVFGQNEAKSHDETPCIRCGRCVFACPVGLKPYLLNAQYEQGDLDAMEKEHVKDCILCGSCSYSCPARRWLVASFQIGKEEIARRAMV